MDDNESLQKVMVLDTRWGCDELTVVDDGSAPSGNSGFNKYDDEGVPTRRIFLSKTDFLQADFTVGKQPAKWARKSAETPEPSITSSSLSSV